MPVLKIRCAERLRRPFYSGRNDQTRPLASAALTGSGHRAALAHDVAVQLLAGRDRYRFRRPARIGSSLAQRSGAAGVAILVLRDHSILGEHFRFFRNRDAVAVSSGYARLPCNHGAALHAPGSPRLGVVRRVCVARTGRVRLSSRECASLCCGHAPIRGVVALPDSMAGQCRLGRRAFLCSLRRVPVVYPPAVLALVHGLLRIRGDARVDRQDCRAPGWVGFHFPVVGSRDRAGASRYRRAPA